MHENYITLEEFTNKFNPDNYTRDELYGIVGMTLTILAQCHDKLNGKR